MATGSNHVVSCLRLMNFKIIAQAHDQSCRQGFLLTLSHTAIAVSLSLLTPFPQELQNSGPAARTLFMWRVREREKEAAL
jgi:hypothetical protein